VSAVRCFTSWLAPYLDGYVALRRASESVYNEVCTVIIDEERSTR
jgi:hypothetical protein